MTLDDNAALPRDRRLQPLGEPHGLRQIGGIGQLVVTLLQHVAIGADALRQDLVHERLDRVPRARQRAQVLDLIHEAPELFRVGVVLRAALREGAHRREKLACVVDRRVHFLQEMLRQHRPRESLERHRVVGIPHHAQRRDHVTDHIVLDERPAARQPAGNRGAQQAPLEVFPDLVLAVQDRVVAPAELRGGAVGDDVLEQPCGLRVLVPERHRAHLVLGLPVGRELLLEQARVVGQDAPRGLEDLVRRAAILVQHDGALDPVIPAKPLEYLRVRARPREDRLLVVSHGEEVVVRRGEPLQDVVLRRVHVLELVHQQIVPAGGDRIGHVAPRLEQRGGLADQVVEVEHVPPREIRRVLAVQAQFVGGEPVLLEAVAAEAIEHAAAPFGGHPQAAEDDALVVLVGHAESLGQARRLGVLAQDREAQRVDRPARHGVGPVAQLVPQARGDLLGRPVRERDGADARGVEAQRADQMIDAADQAERLAGARARDHEDGAEGRGDGEALLGQRVEVHDPYSLAHSRQWQVAGVRARWPST